MFERLRSFFNFDVGEAVDEMFDRDFRREPKETVAVRSAGDALKHLGLRAAHFRPMDDDPLGLCSARATTVVYRPRKDAKHTIEIATAVCSERDPFDRKQGIQLAVQRFMSGQTTHLPPMHAAQTDYELLAGTFQ